MPSSKNRISNVPKQAIVYFAISSFTTLRKRTIWWSIYGRFIDGIHERQHPSSFCNLHHEQSLLHEFLCKRGNTSSTITMRSRKKCWSIFMDKTRAVLGDKVKRMDKNTQQRLHNSCLFLSSILALLPSALVTHEQTQFSTLMTEHFMHNKFLTTDLSFLWISWTTKTTLPQLPWK